MFRSPIIRDAVLLLARVGIGVVFIAHGWQKLSDFGIDGVAAGFEQMDVPFATASAWFAALVELIGGAALVVGLVTPLAGILLVVDMVGAYIFAHVGNGMFVDQDGAELVLALGAASLVFAGIGGGRLSLDHVIAPRLGVAKGSKARASAG